ncbi:hypothetical protein [Paraburkholderia sp. MM5477-R1]|uniref:hypothetical protein n=1 Tax=Paraburkholderia sp. MM5477-R1 TaxID=2991062 RepID=UPI003D25F3D3
MRFFVPKAYAAGLRLAESAARLWDAFEDAHIKANLDGPVEIGMKYFTAAVEAALLFGSAPDSETLKFDALFWNEMVERSRYVLGQKASRPMWSTITPRQASRPVMNITAAIPPDWSDHSWQPLVLPTRIVPARYTTRPEWSSDGESMWMRLSKFSALNRLSLHALASLVAVRADETCCAGVDLRRADRFVSSRLCSLLEIAEAAALDGFCLPSGHPALAWAAIELRYCPKCLERGFHAAWFQWRFIERCPVHGSRLRGGCHKCAAAIPYTLNSNLAKHPLACAYCGTPWVPGLNRSAGRCVPANGRLARIFKRWQIHVADAMMAVAAMPVSAARPGHGKIRASMCRRHRNPDAMLGPLHPAVEPALRSTATFTCGAH